MIKINIIHSIEKILSILTIALSTMSLFSINQVAATPQNKVDTLIRGKVIDTKSNRPLAGATIRINHENTGTRTNDSGLFKLNIQTLPTTLKVSYIGYQWKEIYLKRIPFPLIIRLQRSKVGLKGIVVSTGYQSISDERATGSFGKINQKLIHREVSTDILSRLEGKTSGLSFDKRASTPQISIHGRSTLFGDSKPLIILNNFPYEGDISNINPNDVKSITILKDAAAASIWGVRAANGVIVITTKQGNYLQPLTIGFNSNITIIDKPDLFYNPDFLQSSDFIGVEKMLFNKGFYDNLENRYDYPPLTPVVELLFKAKNGEISTNILQKQIAALKSIDVRRDFNEYWYQKGINQQYFLNLQGGGKNANYYLSAGYDHNLSNLSDLYKRFNVRSDNHIKVLDNLQLTVGLNLTKSSNIAGKPSMSLVNSGLGRGLYPYARLADNKGNPLSIVKNYNTRLAEDAEDKGLLNWEYVPLVDYKHVHNESKSTDVLINTGLQYKLSPSFNISIKYQYEQQQNNGNILYDKESFFARDFVNRYTQIGSDGALQQPIPEGSIKDISTEKLTSQSIRGQLNFNHTWSQHRLVAIGGIERRGIKSSFQRSRLYGFDENVLTHAPVDYNSYYYLYNYSGLIPAKIPDNTSSSAQNFIYISQYANAAYTYKDRYTLSASARKDASNLFGVRQNQKGVPLYSLGVAWIPSQEGFYQSKFLPYLKVRATYGYNGNVDNSLSAFTTIMYEGKASITSGRYAEIRNPPNPDLGWEKTGVFNIGIDFKLKNDMLDGNIDFYKKRGKDLIGYAPVDPTTGVMAPATLSFEYKGNVASMKGSGIDLELQSKNIDRNFKWYSTFIFNYHTDKVTHYYSDNDQASNYVGSGLIVNPLEGKPVYSVLSYKWSGLNPQNGDPQGILYGKTSTDYSKILSDSKVADLVFNGSALPVSFGSVMNTFGYKNLKISFNILYKFNYFFKRASIDYYSLFNFWKGNRDFENRWQKPGDEKVTNVPAMIYPDNRNRDRFYSNSSTLIEKGDNIRLQDISISYRFDKTEWENMPFKNLRIYAYVNNIGILWRANNYHLDPDYLNDPPPVSFSIGLQAGL